jgi:hypothetical protein
MNKIPISEAVLCEGRMVLGCTNTEVVGSNLVQVIVASSLLILVYCGRVHEMVWLDMNLENICNRNGRRSKWALSEVEHDTDK